MKHKKGLLLAVAVMTLALVFAGCGGSSDGPSGTPITNDTDGQRAASASTQSASLAMGSTSTFMGLADVGMSALGQTNLAVPFPSSIKKDPALAITSDLAGKFSKTHAVAAAVTAAKRAIALRTPHDVTDAITCTDGGNATFTGTYDDVALTFDLQFTFNQCREGSTIINGSYRLQGSETNLAITMSNLSVEEYDAQMTSVLYAITANVTLGLSASMNSSQTAATLVLTAQGSLTAQDNVQSISYELNYNNFSETLSMSQTTQVFTGRIAVNGSIGQSWTIGPDSYSLTVRYTNFTLQIDEYATYDTMTVNGVVSIDFTPNDYCFEGTFVIQTITPVKTDNNVGYTVEGEVVINGSTTIVWNPDGTVTVTVTGGQPQDYSNIDELDSTCGFATIE